MVPVVLSSHPARDMGKLQFENMVFSKGYLLLPKELFDVTMRQKAVPILFHKIIFIFLCILFPLISHKKLNAEMETIFIPSYPHFQQIVTSSGLNAETLKSTLKSGSLRSKAASSNFSSGKGNDFLKSLKYAFYLWKRRIYSWAGNEFSRSALTAGWEKNTKNQEWGLYCLEYSAYAAFFSGELKNLIHSKTQVDSVTKNYETIDKKKLESFKKYMNNLTNLFIGDFYFSNNKFQKSEKAYNEITYTPKSHIAQLIPSRLLLNDLFLKIDRNELLETINNNPSLKNFPYFKNPKLAEDLEKLKFLSEEYRFLRNSYLTRDRKSLFGAVLLASLVPGSGHVYTERYGDAIISFLTVLAFSGLSIWGYIDKSYGFSAIMGLGAIAFYGGNIYGAYRSAQDYNRKTDQEFLFQLKLKLWNPIRRPGGAEK
jgi:hypothetical protein